MTACVQDTGGGLHFRMNYEKPVSSDGGSATAVRWERTPPSNDGYGGVGTSTRWVPQAPLALAQSPHSDAIRQLTETQAKCAADLAALHARVLGLEQRVMSTATSAELAVASSRMPILISDGQSMSRLIANAAIEPEEEEEEQQLAVVPVEEAPAAAASPEEAVEPAVPAANQEEFLALTQRCALLEEARADDVAGLRAAIEATQQGMAKLAHDLAIERSERSEVVHEIQQVFSLGASIDRFQKALKAECTDMIRDSMTSAQSAVSSRVQLMLLELREEVQRTPRPLAEAGKLGAATGGVERSLGEWLPSEADGDVASTRAMLTYLGVFDGMLDGSVGAPDQLVARPTFRFMHRAVIAIKHATGYPSGILEDWPDPYDAKLVFLRSVWSSVASTLELNALELDAEGVLKCTNRSGARRLLQLLAIAASKERGQRRHRGQWPQPPAA